MLFKKINKLKATKEMEINRKQQFTNIYEKNLWGGNAGEFYSGSGSYREDLIAPYIEWLSSFIVQENIQNIVDLGCGDFNVGSRLTSMVSHYTGVDIVEKVIQSNIKKYGNDNVNFMCLDIVSDDLPDGELCLVRQVLQHLSNAEIQRILDKLKKYKYSVIVEMVYDKAKAHQYNADINMDRSTRRNQKSRVYLEEAPFCKEIEIIKILPYSENINLCISLLYGDP